MTVSSLEREYDELYLKGLDLIHSDIQSFLKAELLKGLQEASLEEVEGPMIFGTHDNGEPAWRIVYTKNGWPLIIGKDQE